MEQFITVLYALPVYQSLILAVLLFLSGWHEQGHSRMLMALFLFLTSIYCIFNLLYNLHRYDLLIWFYVLILPAILGFIPLLYLYIESVTTPGFRFSKRHLVHFIPSGIIFVLNIPFFLIPWKEQLSYVSMEFFKKDSPFVLRYLLTVYFLGLYLAWNGQMIGYFFKIRRSYKKHREYISNHYSYTEKISLRWISALIICFLAFFLINELLYVFGLSQHPAPKIFYNGAMLWITLFAGYHGLMQRDLGREIEADVTGIPQGAGESPRELPGIKVKYQRSSLTEEQKLALIGQLEKLMKEQKIFTNNRLSVDDVAQKLGANTKYISQVLNEHYHKNFYNFINYYRVEEAKQLLLSDHNRRYSILGISQLAGFSSKSSFNEAFKTLSGVTPSEFRNQHQAGNP